MTTNVDIKNNTGHWNVKVFRRFPKTGAETELAELDGTAPLEHAAVWNDCELVIREVEKES